MMIPLIKRPNPGEFIFPERLTQEEVERIPMTFFEESPPCTHWSIDLSAVTLVDSAFLALLLEILRYTRKCHITLTCTGLSPAIQPLLKVYGIAPLFEGIIQ